MIIFDLSCSCGCQFEGWFRDRDDLEAQQRAGILQCPYCGGREVRKILSPVAVQKGNSEARESALQESSESEAGTVQVLKILRAVSRFVCDHFDDVGTRLAEESLKMHYGIEEPRNLRGVASEEEEGMLREEGIELVKIPLLTEEDESN
jgi:hypothetical protein